MWHTRSRRPHLILALVIAAALAPMASGAGSALTLLPGFTCAGVTPAVSAPLRSTRNTTTAALPGVPTPTAAGDFDLLYIDLMVPSQASAVAVAQVAWSRLHDPRLRALAHTISTTESAQVRTLLTYRHQFYGSADPATLTPAAVCHLPPSLRVALIALHAEPDPDAQVARFRVKADPDRAFIDLMIRHDERVIVASRAAVRLAVHPQLRHVAGGVIATDRQQLAELRAVREHLDGAATRWPWRQRGDRMLPLGLRSAVRPSSCSRRARSPHLALLARTDRPPGRSRGRPGASNDRGWSGWSWNLRSVVRR